ncbi:MAG: HlyD family efflux transporter periplasmic adaptor subunit [Verrucomicrobia bacterium]|nr:HlyD family efflux transporter periplasmic adaptor subunit [Verrucomicrobiota bacterium]
MDVQRQDVAARRRKRRILFIGGGIALVAIIGFGLSQLKPPVYRVDESSVWVETVKRGELLREVSGIGTLVPENNRLITANSSGIVEELIIYPGTAVEPDSVILVMSNPQLVLDAANARFDLAASEADFAGLKIQLQGTLLQMESALTQLKAQYDQARLQADVDVKLFEEGLVAELTYLKSKLNSEQLKDRVDLEQRRFDFQTTSNDSQIATQQARLNSVRGRYELLQDQVERLNVKAGMRGVLQQLLVEVGQQVTPATVLAEAADPNQLKAVIQISETQAKDITIGQSATVDTRNGIVNGRVMRVDPSVVNGTVAVDIELPDELPRGARPDLTVEGKIELENMQDVIYVARPAFARENSSMGIYKFDLDGSYAVRTTVLFGRSSVSSIEVIGGLEPGDSIIASDTSRFETHNRIQIQ